MLSEKEELQVRELLGYLRAFPLHLGDIEEEATKPVPRRSNTKRKGSRSTSARLNLILDASLKEWVHRYAKKRRTTVTALINQFLLELRDKER